MAVLPIRTFGDPVLKEACPQVEEIDEDIMSLIEDLTDTLPKPGGAGLSANQIGVVKRVFVFDNEGEIEACINPRIISRSEDTMQEAEGCLSLPGVFIPVERNQSIEVEYMNIEGEKVQVNAEGWTARVFQHEIDHLDGVLILDRTERERRVEAIEALQAGRPLIRDPGQEQHVL